MAASLPHGLLAKRKQPYPWAAAASLGVHAIVFFVFASGAIAGSCGAHHDASQKPIAAKLVRLGKPRDPNYLPRKPTAPPPPEAAKAAPVVIPEPPKPAPTAKAVVPTKTEKAAAPPQPKKPDTKQRLDDIMRNFERDAVAGPAEELPGQLDGDVEGDSEQAEEGERYLALVRQRIKQKFDVPATIAEQERIHLRTRIVIWVQRNGEISKHEITAPSSNATFDSAITMAVQRASPLPPPPEHLVALLSREGIEFDFRP